MELIDPLRILLQNDIMNYQDLFPDELSDTITILLESKNKSTRMSSQYVQVTSKI